MPNSIRYNLTMHNGLLWMVEIGAYGYRGRIGIAYWCILGGGGGGGITSKCSIGKPCH